MGRRIYIERVNAPFLAAGGMTSAPGSRAPLRSGSEV
jgi:hypothetical protein